MALGWQAPRRCQIRCPARPSTRSAVPPCQEALPSAVSRSVPGHQVCQAGPTRNSWARLFGVPPRRQHRTRLRYEPKAQQGTASVRPARLGSRSLRSARRLRPRRSGPAIGPSATGHLGRRAGSRSGRSRSPAARAGRRGPRSPPPAQRGRRKPAMTANRGAPPKAACVRSVAWATSGWWLTPGCEP
jgi:hypothetical protein